MRRAERIPSQKETPAQERSAKRAQSSITPLAHRVEDAAGMVGVSTSMIWKLIREGKLRSSKIGRATVIPHGDLVALIGGSAADAPPQT
ncbi:helix-turn-helix domain-containing protein [Methylobacterium nodulans]|uniref:Helix-turn-helix domain-containing protein n=1 Tax=Methylobacterium nodulans (strain LMG 21967 / CNCM I-2342 / ORS 2060) TaxID=460265 RepID=B8IIS7_METNO|nr:helix-turn-helix domain-containing protein [Methylobacterium nodulans]ACL59954.1 hypothetical protein Mnod_5108 [Methylobacterium nodulans ORS 2060]